MQQGNMIKRARRVKAIVDEFYEPHSMRGSMLNVYRHKVYHQFPISQATFYRYMDIAIGIDGYIGNGQNRIRRTKKRVAPTDDYPCLPLVWN